MRRVHWEVMERVGANRLAPHEHDDDAISPFRPSHVHEPSPYVCASRRSRPRPYVHIRGRIFFLAPCTPLHPPVYMYVHVRDQNDNATYTSTRWVPTVRHFLACEDVAGGSQQSGGRIIFFVSRAHFLACEDVAGGSLLSGGGIIILRVIRRHFLAAALDPALSVSTHSTLPMEVGR